MQQSEIAKAIYRLRREGWSDTKIINYLLEIIGYPIEEPKAKEE